MPELDRRITLLVSDRFGVDPDTGKSGRVNETEHGVWARLLNYDIARQLMVSGVDSDFQTVYRIRWRSDLANKHIALVRVKDGATDEYGDPVTHTVLNIAEVTNSANRKQWLDISLVGRE